MSASNISRQKVACSLSAQHPLCEGNLASAVGQLVTRPDAYPGTWEWRLCAESFRQHPPQNASFEVELRAAASAKTYRLHTAKQPYASRRRYRRHYRLSALNRADSQKNTIQKLSVVTRAPIVEAALRKLVIGFLISIAPSEP